MLNAAGTAPIGDIKYTQMWLGAQGWSTGITASRDGLWAMCWFDVCPFFARRLSVDEPFICTVLPGKVPADMLGVTPDGAYNVPGASGGGWWGGFGGPDASVCYQVYYDGLYVSKNFTGARTFTKTALTGKVTDANEQTISRTFAGKGATDPINANVCYVNMSNNGLYRTLDGGTTVPKVTWVPDPAAMPGQGGYDPACRYGIVAVDEAGPTITVNGAQMKGRVAYCPNGGGVWLSADAMGSGSKITTTSGAGNFTSVSAMKWIGGKLFCCIIDGSTLTYSQAISASTGGAGNTAIGKADNVRVYDPTGGGSWSIVAHGMSTDSQNLLGWPQFIHEDPRYPGVGYYLWTGASEVAHTTDGTTFTYTGLGNGSYYPSATAANKVAISTFLRTVPTDRPNVASRYRNGGQCFALSDPIVVKHPTTGNADALIVAPTGFGPLATRLADWPTQNLVYPSGNPQDPAKAPLWREVTGGAEAKVGQAPLFLGDKLWNGAQDISISLAERGQRGHTAAVYSFPPTGALSDSDDVARGHIPNFGVTYRQRSGSSHVMGIAYTLDNTLWQVAPNQMPSYQGVMNPYSPATIACGANYSCVAMPGWCFGSTTPGLVPSVWADVRSSTPQAITFKKEDGTIVPALFNQGAENPPSYSGFHAAFFSNPSKKVAIDPANPSRYYFWNIGGTTNTQGDSNGPNGWVNDPADVGGIYMMDVNGPNPTTATRVYSAKAATGYGSPQRNGNFGSFDTAMLIAGGYMVLNNNYLSSGPADTGQRPVVLTMSNWTRRQMNSGPGNFQTLCFGDPISGTMPVLWGAAWASDGSVFGVWFSPDWWTANPTWNGPYNVAMPTGGWAARMDAHLAIGNETRRFGQIAFACRTRGLVFGQFQLG